jgi:hypothetical protein
MKMPRRFRPTGFSYKKQRELVIISLIYGDKMSKYENLVMELFKKAKLKFYREKTFKDLKKGLFRFDFYIQNYHGAPAIVEVDGEQHFKPIYGRQAFLKA